MKSSMMHLAEGRSTWRWSPQEHVCTALYLIGELENELRVRGSIMPERYYLVRLLAATRRQLWLAVAALESRRSSPSWRVRPRRVAQKPWAAMVLQGVVAWSVFAVGFALNCGWRYTRAALRVLWRN